MAKTAYDGKRGVSTFLIPAYDLTVIGGDGPNDLPAAGHPLAKADVMAPIPDTFIRDMRTGQNTPIKVQKDRDGHLVVLFGNTRTRAIRQIVTDDGTIGTPEEMLVECQFVARGTSVRDAQEIGMSENTNRKVLSGVAIARQAQAYIAVYGDDKETMARCAMRNGLSVTRLNMLLEMLEHADPALLVKMESGDMGIEAVIALSKLEPEVQREQLQAAAVTGKSISTSKARAAARMAHGKSVAPAKRELRSEWKELVEVEAKNDVLVSVPAMMAWILGEGPKPEWTVVPKKATAAGKRQHA